MKTGLGRNGKLAGGLGLLLALVLIIALGGSALAIPVVPPLPHDHQFYGTVRICGELAEEGTVVTARIADVAGEWTSRVVYDVPGHPEYDGYYGLNDPLDYPNNLLLVPADDPTTPAIKEGGVVPDIVEFYVLGSLAGQFPFDPNGITELDLQVCGVTHTLTMAKVGQGTVAPGSGSYPEGDMTITATQDPGWEFAGWTTDDMTEIDSPSSASTTLTLDKDKTVTATFTFQELPGTLGLVEGVNIITYTGATASLPGALTNIGPSGLDVVDGIWARGAWTGGEWLYYNARILFGTLSQLEAGKAYIIVVTQDCTWELP